MFIDFQSVRKGLQHYLLGKYEHYKSATTEMLNPRITALTVTNYHGNMYNCYMTAEIPATEYGLNFQEKVLLTGAPCRFRSVVYNR